MIPRITSSIAACALLAGALACADRVSSPRAGLAGSGVPTASHSDDNGRTALLPGELSGGRRRDGDDNGGSDRIAGARLVRCESHPALSGSGLIGPSGGEIVAGSNRLVIPPGALTHPVYITATVPEGEYAFIHFEPSGLQFRKPAGLVLDASGCDIDDDYVPDVVYIEHGEAVERIEAVYSTHWKTVAAPINHFSGYALAW